MYRKRPFVWPSKGDRGGTPAKVDACLRGGEVRRPGYAPRQQHHRSERLGSGKLAGKPTIQLGPPKKKLPVAPKKEVICDNPYI